MNQGNCHPKGITVKASTIESFIRGDLNKHTHTGLAQAGKRLFFRVEYYSIFTTLNIERRLSWCSCLEQRSHSMAG
jgi:hypothetical protein